MADTNNTAIRFVEETTIGTTPTNPAFQQFCHTGAGFNSNPVLLADPRICGITSSRAPEAPTLLGFAPDGTLPIQLSHEVGYFLPGLLQRAYDAQNFRTNRTSGSDQITDISSGAITVSSGTAFAAGDLVYIYGSADSTEDGVYVATAGGATSVTVAGITDDASPPATMEIRLVGFEGDSGDLSTTTSGGNKLVSAAALNFTSDFNLSVGDWIKIGGTATASKFATAGCNGWCRISAISATTLTFDRVPTGFATDAGTSKEIRVFIGDAVYDGRTKLTYTAEMNYLAEHGTNLYNVFPGVYPNSISFSGENRDTAQAITGTIGFNGITEPTPSTTRTSGASTLLPMATSPYVNGDQVARIAEGGTVITDVDAAVLSLSLDINNNLQRLGGWGYNAGVGMRAGDLTIGGTLETYFNDLTRYNKVLNNTSSSIETILTDPKYGFALAIDLPNVEFTGDPSAEGRGGVHTLPLQYTAHPDATLGYACKMQRFWAYTDA